MVLPRDARRKGGTIRIGAVIAALFALSCMAALLASRPTHALGLLPSASVTLPTGNLLAPVTNTVNKITTSLSVPVTVYSTPSTLGASVSTPSSTPLQTSVTIPLPSTVPTIVNTVDSVVSPVTQPVADAVSQAASSPSPTLPSSSLLPSSHHSSSQQSATPNTNQSTVTKSPVLSGDEEKSVAVATIAPFLSGVATFIGSVIPSSINNTVKGVTNPGINAVPLLISAGMFILILTLVIGIVYILNHTKMFTVGDGRFAQLAQRYDLTQLSVLTVVLLGAGVIVLYLILSRATG